MYHIGIYGENAEAERLKQTLRTFGKKEGEKLAIEIWSSLEELTNIIKKGKEIDVIFLRLDPEGSAIRFGKFLREERRNFQTQLIYMAEKECYTREIIQTLPLDFYLEKNGKETAGQLLRRAIAVIKQAGEKFEFRFGRNYYSIPIEDILYVCSDLRRLRVKTLLGEFEFNGLLRDLISRLPKDFLVIHKSFVVNGCHVRQFNNETVLLSDGTQLAISKTNRTKVKSFLTKGR
ncbi:MAG: LytTR family transcriptional regulator [Lachnospiraceae bacterium]|nr:LytTR family transcriptional regulator [Lachnospiraceae bacterium]